MANSSNFDNGGELFNIFLDPSGNLLFNANNVDGAGDTRMSINDDTGNVGISTTAPVAKLQVINATQDANGNTLILGPTNASNLRLGYDTDYSWVQSHGTRPLAINPIGNNVGIGTTNPTEKLEVNGNIKANNVTAPSDLRYKEDITSLSDALDIVLAMRGVRYQWKQEELSERQIDQHSQIGFIGQEVEILCPEVVFTDSKGYKSLDYSRLTPVLVEAIKEQQHLIQQQQSMLETTLAKVEHLETTLHT